MVSHYRPQKCLGFVTTNWPWVRNSNSLVPDVCIFSVIKYPPTGFLPSVYHVITLFLSRTYLILFVKCQYNLIFHLSLSYFACRKQILCSTYDTIKSASSAWVDSVELPYPLDGADSAGLMSNYGTELDSSHTWSGKSHSSITGYYKHNSQCCQVILPVFCSQGD